MEKLKPLLDRMCFIEGEVLKDTYPNCRTLADDYEVSEKTIQTTLDYMRDSMKAPLKYNSSKRGYYYTDPHFRIMQSNIEIDESDFFAICIADKALSLYANTPLHEKLTKAFEKIRDSLPEKIQVRTTWLSERYTFMEDPATTINMEVWDALGDSLQSQRELAITHHKVHDDGATERVVRPYHVVNFKGEWYLIAWCTLRKEIRIFAISRIDEARVLDKAFTIPEDFDIHHYLGNSTGIILEDEFEVTISFSSELAPYIRERFWHREQKIEEQDDSTLYLTMPARSVLEIKRWVLSWGSEARVIKPEKLARQIRGEAEKILSVYGE